MKRLAIVLIGLGLVLSGCSSAPSEVSPQQKRNNFDYCVIDYMNTGNRIGSRAKDFYQERAQVECAKYLK